MPKNADHAREVMLHGIRRELLGPAACGFALAVPPTGSVPDAFQPHVDSETGEEILAVEAPLNRYGLGVIFPKSVGTDVELSSPDTEGALPNPPDSEALDGSISEASEEGLSNSADKKLDEILNRSGKADRSTHASDETDSGDFVDTTRRKASSMAVSFRLNVSTATALTVTLPAVEPGTLFPVNGRYERFNVRARYPTSGEERDLSWWVRRQVSGKAVFEIPHDLKTGERRRLRCVEHTLQNAGPLEVEFSAFARQFPEGDQGDIVVTVVLANRTPLTSGKADEYALFQSYFEVTLTDENDAMIVPLPGLDAKDEASKSLEFVYREAGTIAVGHGCAGDWATRDGSLVVIATHFPNFEVPSMTPELPVMNKLNIELSMTQLAGLSQNGDGIGSLRKLSDAYEQWLEEQTKEASKLVGGDKDVARRHLIEAQAALARMRSGIELIETNSQIRRAFELMNHAMLLQQIASRAEVRQYSPPSRKRAANYSPSYVSPHHSQLPDGRGMWRPFQIGFILSALESTANRLSTDRELVDLIWFPTGGGKTEAYLGLSAFSGFLRRLRDPQDSGTEILMRYTLRLLTAQQFERATSLICAMEVIRRDSPNELGSDPYSIGLWVGGGTTPNRWADAKQALREITSGARRNPFLVSKCPWCGAELGPHKSGPLGYSLLGNKVRISCHDPACQFHDELPVRVVDEDLYERPPTLLIATVDKYAQLSWNPRARAFFGLSDDGERKASPPNLIIQDELHLITGPLGSMVGSFEVIVEHLCTHKVDPTYKPKIVCSTATIRNYSDQVRWLFSRERTSLFPPPALDIDDSFFGVKATSSDGSDAPGRKYVGIFAPALGSHMSVQIRVYAAALQSVMNLAPEDRDPYWTLLGFFNTLRDLGSTTTLLRDQIKSHLLTMWRRHGVLEDALSDMRRRINEVEELTGRLRSEEVPATLALLGNSLGSGNKAVDVCLASNMIEVGIDVDRLGLMVVTGQPKTNAQYIQVTGRVGRDWSNRPGLVIVAYSPNRARDRSVFETFRANHERMYAYVEPASVTPFSLPALERALHATMIAYIRQTKPLPFDDPSRVEVDDLSAFKRVLMSRVGVVDPEATAEMEKQFDRRVREWQTRQPTVWEDWQSPDNPEALQVPASTQGDDWRWRTAQSMRNVDAECFVDTLIVRKMDLEREGQDGA